MTYFQGKQRIFHFIILFFMSHISIYRPLATANAELRIIWKFEIKGVFRISLLIVKQNRKSAINGDFLFFVSGVLEFAIYCLTQV